MNEWGGPGTRSNGVRLSPRARAVSIRTEWIPLVSGGAGQHEGDGTDWLQSSKSSWLGVGILVPSCSTLPPYRGH